MLDALLINPVLHKGTDSIWKTIDACMPPLGLAYIAAYARKKGFSIKIIDCPAINISLRTFGRYIKSLGIDNIRYVGFTATTPSVNNAYEMAKIIRTIYPHSKIVFGGPHPTTLPEEAIRKQFIDIIVIGEGEITFAEILSGKKLEDINGLCYLNKGKITYSSPRKRIKNLDALPSPAYDLLPMTKYFPARGSYQKLPAISMLASRGCPGKCTFCNKILGNLLVYRSAESLCEEIKMLKNMYGARQIMFYDDTFTTFKDNACRFCQLLIEQNVGISWTCFSRVDFVDFELLKLMKKAGCHQIMFGIESASEDILRTINKKTNLSAAKNAILWAKTAGIDVRCAFMIGNPSETKGSILKTLTFAIKQNPEYAIFNIATPYPGTKMFEDAKAKNKILTYNWDTYDLSEPVMKLDYLTSNELKFYYRYCYKKFYFRLNYILLWLFKIIKNPLKIKALTEGLNSLLLFYLSA